MRTSNAAERSFTPDRDNRVRGPSDLDCPRIRAFDADDQQIGTFATIDEGVAALLSPTDARGGTSYVRLKTNKMSRTQVYPVRSSSRTMPKLIATKSTPQRNAGV